MSNIPERDPRSILDTFRSHVDAYRPDVLAVQHDDWVRRWNELRWRWVEAVRQRPELTKQFLQIAGRHATADAVALFQELNTCLNRACYALAHAICGSARFGPDLQGLRDWGAHVSAPWSRAWKGSPAVLWCEKRESAPHLLRELGQFRDRLGDLENSAFSEAIGGVPGAIKRIDAFLLDGREAELSQAAHYYLCAYHAYAPEDKRDDAMVYSLEGVALPRVSPCHEPSLGQYLGAIGRGADQLLDDKYYNTREGNRAEQTTLSLQRMEVLTDWLCPPGASKGTDVAEWGPLRVSIEDIKEFSAVGDISPEKVMELLDERGRLEALEDDIQTGLEEVLDVPCHKKDWGGEKCDLYTANVTLKGRRVQAAFLLKGKGLRKPELVIGDCGKNGDQLVRLFDCSAELFVVEFVGQVSEGVIRDVEGKTELHRRRGKPAWYCIINGQDTARLLKAYDKLPRSADTG